MKPPWATTNLDQLSLATQRLLFSSSLLHINNPKRNQTIQHNNVNPNVVLLLLESRATMEVENVFAEKVADMSEDVPQMT